LLYENKKENRYFKDRDGNNSNYFNNDMLNLNVNRIEYRSNSMNKDLNNNKNNNLEENNRDLSDIKNEINYKNNTNNVISNNYKNEPFDNNHFRSKYRSLNANENINLDRKYNYQKSDEIKNDWKDRELKDTNSFLGSKIGSSIGNVSAIDDKYALNSRINIVLDLNQELERKREENNILSKKFSSEKRTFRYEQKSESSINKANNFKNIFS